jgi:group I intron endonuclease
MIYTIYKITNRETGKVYIGYTQLNPEKRFSQHRQYAFNTNHKGKLLYKAVLKYGVAAFNFEVIYQSKDREHALDMETYFITEYRAWVDFPDAHGYNLTIGGRQAVKSAASKAAQSAKMKGRKQEPEHAAKKGFGVCPNPSFKGMAPTREWTPEQRAIKAAQVKDYYASGATHPFLGRTHSEETKQKVSKAKKKTFHILDIYGNEYDTDDLPAFATLHGFNKDTIRNYSRRGEYLKGYFIAYTLDQKGKKTVYGQQ